MASLNVTAGAPAARARVSQAPRIRRSPPGRPALSSEEIHESDCSPWLVNAATMAPRTASACWISAQAKIAGPAPEIEHPSAPADMAPRCTSLNPGIKDLALRLDDHVVEGIANHVQIVRVAAADETREIRASARRNPSA